MKVFLDTNVLASAFGTRGLCADVLRKTLVGYELVCSDLVLNELARTLQTKFRLSASAVAARLAFLRESAEITEPAGSAGIKIKQESDAEILSSALAAGVQVFVTGDRELVELIHLGEMRIVNPRTFWEQF